MVTFHHFTAPLWFTRDGGWEDAKSVDRFARYCERAGRALGDIIHYACTINEANIPIMVTMMREAVRRRGWRRQADGCACRSRAALRRRGRKVRALSFRRRARGNTEPDRRAPQSL